MGQEEHKFIILHEDLYIDKRRRISQKKNVKVEFKFESMLEDKKQFKCEGI